MERTSRGVIFIILSALGFALMSFFVTLSGHLPFAEKVMFRNGISLLVACAVLLGGKEPLPRGRKTWAILALRCVLGTVGVFCNFYALDHLVLSDASMLNKLSPFFTLLFSYLFLRERARREQVLLVIGAFLGSLLIIKPTGGGNARFFPALIGLLGGCSAGGAYTCVRALGNRGVKGPLIVFLFSLFSTLATLPLFLGDVVPLSAFQTLCLLASGICGAAGQFCITAAYRYAPSREISIYDYSNVVFSALLGYLFLGQRPDWLSVAGYLVIFSMALLLFRVNRDLERSSAHGL